MFQLAHLTLAHVFSKLGEITAPTGHSFGTKNVEKIQMLMEAARGPDARHFVRSLAGKIRIGLVERSMLKVLAHVVVQTLIRKSYHLPRYTLPTIDFSQTGILIDQAAA